MKEELLKGLSEEQIAKIKTCKNTEEVLAVAKQEGYELTEEQLEAVSGGACDCWDSCPKCHGDWTNYVDFGSYKQCLECGYRKDK